MTCAVFHAAYYKLLLRRYHLNVSFFHPEGKNVVCHDVPD